LTPASFDLQISNDGINWTNTGASVGTFLGSLVPQTVVLSSPVSARYIRVFSYAAPGALFSIAEMETYATAPDSIEQLFDFNVMGVKNDPNGNIVLTNNTSLQKR